MSHLKERAEKTCLNCNAALYGRYCHVCGQENLEPKETVWHLVQHFFNDITHFDGKFFSTVKYLLRKPGFLSHEYMAGRRMSYLNPIRMYVFTSAIFFLILFALKHPSDMVNVNVTPPEKESLKNVSDLKKTQTRLEKSWAEERDKEDKEDLEDQFKRNGLLLAEIKKTYGDTTSKSFSKKERDLLLGTAYLDSTLVMPSLSGDSALPRDAEIKKALGDTSGKVAAGGAYRYPGKVDESKLHPMLKDKDLDKYREASSILDVAPYKRLGEYDTVQHSLPDSLRDGWFTRLVKRKLILANEERHQDQRKYYEHVMENILHSIPKILFFSLPIFAMILNILYFRHKQYYYVDHGIFAIHLYCATFILTMCIFLISQLTAAVGLHWVTVLGILMNLAIGFYIMIYLYKAMRGFYKQRRAKTFIKYVIVSMLSFIVYIFLLTIFTLISAVSV